MLTIEQLKQALSDFDQFLNEPPEYEDKHMVRDYRHAAYRKWAPICIAVDALIIRSAQAAPDAGVRQPVASDEISITLNDARMLLSWMDATFGNDQGADWIDEDAAAVGDMLHKLIADFHRMRAAIQTSAASPPPQPAVQAQAMAAINGPYASPLVQPQPEPAPQPGGDALTDDIARLMAMTETEIDAELRSMGIDPEGAAHKANRAIHNALAVIRARKGDALLRQAVGTHPNGHMPSYGTVPWDDLIAAVGEATGSAFTPDDRFHIGHQLTGINFNSLNRIVSKFLDANTIVAIRSHLAREGQTDGPSDAPKALTEAEIESGWYGAPQDVGDGALEVVRELVDAEDMRQQIEEAEASHSNFVGGVGLCFAKDAYASRRRAAWARARAIRDGAK